MNSSRFLAQVFICSGLWLATTDHVSAISLQQERVATTPVVLDGVLYAASSEYLSHRGHLRAIDILGTFPTQLWDAADKMPMAGTNAFQADDIWVGNQSRYLLTNVSDQITPLDAGRAGRLMSSLNVSSAEEAEQLLHAVRGRRGGTLEEPAGNREDAFRLWGISRSSPLVIGGSAVVSNALTRDRVLYAGAEDGMLHAFFISRWDDLSGEYPLNHPDGGTELWAYVPGSFLPFLQNQPVADATGEPVIHLDSSPVVKEVYLDLDGDGHRRWRTLLIATGTLSQLRKSCLFVLDVTDPYQPGLLWEELLPGAGTGRTRGVSVDRCPNSDSECLYLATDYQSTENSAGLHIIAVKLVTGELLWQFSTIYSAAGSLFESTPAVPALMDLDEDERNDTLVIGDLVGQLWAINVVNGQAYRNAPVFTVPGNIEEPIGATVSVYGRTVVFGTGGVAGSSDQREYALYKVKVAPEGGTLLWRFPLEIGAKVWSPPLLDAQGNVLFTGSQNYDPLIDNLGQTSGHLLALNKAGEKISEHETGAAIVGSVVSSGGLVVTVAQSGEVKQFGTASRLSGPSESLGSVRILSWRQR